MTQVVSLGLGTVALYSVQYTMPNISWGGVRGSVTMADPRDTTTQTDFHETPTTTSEKRELLFRLFAYVPPNAPIQ